MRICALQPRSNRIDVLVPKGRLNLFTRCLPSVPALFRSFGVRSSVRVALAAFLVLDVGPVFAAGPKVPQLPFAAESASRQFVILTSARNAFASPNYTDTNLLYLEPGLLPVCCERIKSALYRELEMPMDWRGKIYIAPFASDSPLDVVTILSERMPSRWEYRVNMPNPLDRTRFVRSVVEVLLIEMANRTAGERTAEMPDWLVEGFTQQVMASNPRDFLVPQSRRDAHGQTVRYTLIDAERTNELYWARQRLRATGVLTFEEMSWPTQGELAGVARPTYVSSAQLFVARLLGLPDGAACFRKLMADLPVYYNWQVAFLDAFNPHFQRPRDVERWWALQTVEFMHRNLTVPSLDESRIQLTEALRTPAHARNGTNGLPVTVNVPLQGIIRDWQLRDQIASLSAKEAQLETLRARLAPDLVPIADEYCQVLATYLQDEEKLEAAHRRQPNRPSSSATFAIRQLDELDSRWMAGPLPPPRHEAPKVTLTEGPPN